MRHVRPLSSPDIERINCPLLGHATSRAGLFQEVQRLPRLCRAEHNAAVVGNVDEIIGCERKGVLGRLLATHVLEAEDGALPFARHGNRRARAKRRRLQH